MIELLDQQYIPKPESSIKLEEIVTFLKETLQIKGIYQNILFQRIIHRAAQERNLTVTPEEIQIDADNMRRQKRLEKAADTLAWLSEQMITSEEWEAGIRDRLLAKKLAESLFSKEVEKFFAQNQLDFERILLYQIIIPYEKLAWELFYQIEEEEINFYQAAHLYDIDEKRRHHCGYEGTLYRWSFQPDMAAAIFSARIGEVIPPIKTDQGYHLLLVEEFIPAELTPESYQEILDKMFNDWLASELNYLLHNAGTGENTDTTQTQEESKAT